MVSIIMLSFNAKLYTKHALKTLKYTEEIEYEIIVLDNNSDMKTKEMLKELKRDGYIDKLIFENENTLFAKGNNIAASYCSKNSDYILLLNSDVEIRDKKWLKILFEKHQRGATSFGLCDTPPHIRGDGYCFLIDKDLYLEYKLDEEYEWFWSVTKLQANLLKAGLTVTVVNRHNTLLYHYGGMSGTGWMNSKGLETEGEIIKNWFVGTKLRVINELVGKSSVYNPFGFINVISIFFKIKNKIIKRIKKIIYRSNRIGILNKNK